MNSNIGNMGDMGSMLSKLLEDPESLGKVMNIASTLSSSGVLNGISLGGSDKAENTEAREIKSESVSKQNMPEMRREESFNERRERRIRPCDRIRLLEAMRPFLSDDKRDKLEVVIKIIGLADAAGGLYSVKR